MPVCARARIARLLAPGVSSRCAPVRCRDRLRVNPEESAVLLSEPSHNDRAGRERCVEVLFETCRCPAVFLARAAVLASFAVGRQSSLVVDAGYRGVTGG